MILDNKLIKNRPKELLENDFYTRLPKAPTEFNYKSLPSYLNVDLMTLTGIMPKTRDLVSKTQFGFFSQPSEKEVEYYRQRNSRFQIISVVANIHSFKKVNDNLYSAYPYSLSLIAGQKREKPDECSIELLNKLNLEEISQRKQVYTDFSPFKPVDTGFYADSSFLFGGNDIEHYTDTVGFVLETYFLPTDVDLEDVPMPGPQNLDPITDDKFRKYRVKRYFKAFSDVKPRKIWGCDSPIELFLIQGLAKRNLFPVIQTLIFKNGKIFDNFFEMIKEGTFVKGDELITEVDLYFPEKKLAIFCDSKQFHRGAKNKEKDTLIDNQLAELGIRTLRIPSKLIIEKLNNAVQLVFDSL